MNLLLQIATATPTAVTTTASSGDQEWWKIAAAVAVPTIAFVGVLVAFLKNRKDLKNAETALNDRRLDERIDAKFGQHMTTINSLMDRARETLEEAKASAATVQHISVEVQRTNETILEQARQAEDSRQKLEAALRRADQVVARLDRGARQADKDVEVISAARSTVTRHEDLVEKVGGSLRSRGYTKVFPLGMTFPGADLIAYGDEVRPPLLIETKVLTTKTLDRFIVGGIDSLLKITPLQSAEVFALFNIPDYRYVVVIDDKFMKAPHPLPQRLIDQARDQNISVVRFEEFDRFLQDLAPLDSSSHNVGESE